MKSKKSLVLMMLLIISLIVIALAPVATAAGVSANKTLSKIFINGKEVNIEGYNIGGSNYFKLRDLGSLIDFGVTWDGNNDAIIINPSESYRAGKTSYTPAGEARVLQRNNWAPATYDALNKLIRENGILSPNYDPANRPYVVFDCDNTLVVNDVQEALLIYQLERLAFKIKPEQMQDVLETGIPDVEMPFIEGYENSDGKTLNVRIVAEDCAKDYDYLYNNYEGFGAGGKMSLEEIHKTDEYKDFITKVRYLYDAINDTFDAAVGYPWVTYLFTGMTSAETQALAKESHEYWLNYGTFTKVTWESPASLPGKAGVVSTSYKTGLTFPDEMTDLTNTFMENGIDVYVISASFYDVIVATVTTEKFGYNVKEDNVYAMMLKKDANGRYINEYDYNYFQTQGKGKSHTINAFIRGKYQNRGPIFVAGDSQGDFNMITEYPDMKLGLIVNRYRKDDFKGISQQAAASIGQPDAKYVLQGRDENLGLFRPSEKSILLGEDVERLTR
jgi:phosphoserine phosphatase